MKVEDKDKNKNNEVTEKTINTKTTKSKNKVSMPIYVVFAILLLVAIMVTAIYAVAETYYAVAETYVWSLLFFVPIFILQLVQLIVLPKKDKITNYQVLGIVTTVISVALLISSYVVIDNNLYNDLVWSRRYSTPLPTLYYSIIDPLLILTVVTTILIIVSSVLYLYKVFSTKSIKTNKVVVESNEPTTQKEIEQLKEMLNDKMITKEEYGKMLNQILENEVKVVKSPTRQERKIAKIKELKAMKESGMITEEEYKKMLTDFLVR